MVESKRAYAYYCRECEGYVEAVERRKCWGRYCPNGCDESCALIPDVRPIEAALAERDRRVANLEREHDNLQTQYKLVARRAEDLQEELDDAWRNDHPITNTEMIRRLRSLLELHEQLELELPQRPQDHRGEG